MNSLLIHLIPNAPASEELILGFISMSPGPLELLLIFVVILILFGAQNLPKIARTLGRTMEEFRRAAHDVTSEIMNTEDEDSSAYTPPGQRQPRAVPPPSDEKPEEQEKEKGRDESD